MQSTLRTYLDEIKDDILQINKQVDVYTEVGDLISQADQPIGFNKIKDYPGWRIYDRIISDRNKQALVFNTKPKEVIQVVANLICKGPGETRIVENGPVKEKILIDKEASFNAIPVCVHHPKDAGPYIGSGMCVSIDPDTGFQNVAMHRIYVKSDKHAGIFIFSPHTGSIIKKYKKRREPMPMAVVIGHHPAYEIAANYHGPHDTWDEFMLAGRLLNETVEMIKCENSDITVPAHAEVVLECEIQPDATTQEGPFGEFHGYHASKASLQPRLDIKTITMRHDAIYRQINSTPFTDHQPLIEVCESAMLYDLLKRKGFMVHDVCVPAYGGLFITVLQMTANLEEEVREAMMTTLFSQTLLLSKIVIAVDADIDIYDPREIIYAIATRVDPAKDIITIDGTRTPSLDLIFPLITGAEPFRRGSKLAIDATKPPLMKKEWRDCFDRANPAGWGNVRLADFL